MSGSGCGSPRAAFLTESGPGDEGGLRFQPGGGMVCPVRREAGASLGVVGTDKSRPESKPSEPDLANTSVGKRRRQTSSPLAFTPSLRGRRSRFARRRTDPGIAHVQHEPPRLGAGPPLLRLPRRGLGRRAAAPLRGARLPGRGPARHAAGAGRHAGRHLVRRHPRRGRVLVALRARQLAGLRRALLHRRAALRLRLREARARDAALHAARPARPRLRPRPGAHGGAGGLRRWRSRRPTCSCSARCSPP